MYANGKSNSKDLPTVSIGDESVENAGWKFNDGWQGLIPSVSSIDDAIKILGEVCGESELANGITYDFKEGKVRVTVRNGNDKIARIWIDARASQLFLVPPNICELTKAFGKFVATGVSRNEGAFFERPGMRACCNAMDENSSLLWLEIFAPDC